MTTTLAERAARDMAGQRLKAAERFLIADGSAGRVPLEGEALSEAIGRCADHLVTALELESDQAAEVAITAWAGIVGRDSACFIDLATSSRHLVWLVDPIAQERRAIPVIDLIRILGPREVRRSA